MERANRFFSVKGSSQIRRAKPTNVKGRLGSRADRRTGYQAYDLTATQPPPPNVTPGHHVGVSAAIIAAVSPRIGRFEKRSRTPTGGTPYFVNFVFFVVRSKRRGVSTGEPRGHPRVIVYTKKTKKPLTYEVLLITQYEKNEFNEKRSQPEPGHQSAI